MADEIKNESAVTEDTEAVGAEAADRILFRVDLFIASNGACTVDADPPGADHLFQFLPGCHCKIRQQFIQAHHFVHLSPNRAAGLPVKPVTSAVFKAVAFLPLKQKSPA